MGDLYSSSIGDRLRALSERLSSEAMRMGWMMMSVRMLVWSQVRREMRNMN